MLPCARSSAFSRLLPAICLLGWSSLLLGSQTGTSQEKQAQTNGSQANRTQANGTSAATAAVLTSDAGSEWLHLVVGRSMILTSPRPLRRIYIGNPAVLQTFTSGSTEIILTSRTAGTSSLVLWETSGGRRLYTVSADVDPASLRGALHDAFPACDINAEAREGRIYLSGTVPTEEIVAAAVKLATLYDKDVINSLRVVTAQSRQVQLKLRIVEVDRTRLDQFGINIFGGAQNAISTSTQQFASTATGVGSAAFAAADPLNLLFYNFSNAIGASVKDLEQKNILEVLAEPTLVTISGTPAKFLSGGEFPVPVVQGGTGNSTAVTIIFRPYGVKVDFTPTVGENGAIRLKVSPEVSTLDYSNAVTVAGFTIPALATRRAETEVVIRDGQSFIISGLLDHRTTEILSRLPGIANVPILGQLFRSKNLNHSVVELALIVTAQIVDPLTSNELPVEPRLASPYMDRDAFDAGLGSSKKTRLPLAITPAPPPPAAAPGTGAPLLPAPATSPTATPGGSGKGSSSGPHPADAPPVVISPANLSSANLSPANLSAANASPANAPTGRQP